MKKLSRRTVLRGIGASIALPWLEAMSTTASIGAVASKATSGALSPPKRLAFMYIPNGVIGSKWFPEAVGKDFDLPPSLQPLAEFKQDITVVSGLSRTDLVTAIDTTLDQVIAKELSGATAFPSLEISCNTFADNNEPKIFDAISWYGPGYDAKSTNDPHRLFKRMFGESQPLKQSVLDTVIGDASRINRTLGVEDRRKLDEYLTSIRAVENRMSRQFESKSRLGKVDFKVPDPVPVRRQEYIRLMGDLMVLAFQTDQTRIATMMVGPERWQTPQLYEGVFDKPISHHVLTHDPKQDDVVAKVDRFHVQQYAYLIDRLKTIQEGEKTLLDSCSFVLGSGLEARLKPVGI